MFKKNDRFHFSPKASGAPYEGGKGSSEATNYFRVGTVTSALVLIAFGSAFLIYFIQPYDLAKLLFFCPAILCLLGIEMLVYRLIAPKSQLRYDKKAILFSAILVLIAFIIVSGKNTQEKNRIEDEQRAIRATIEEEIYNDIFDRIDDENSPVLQLRVSSYDSSYLEHPSDISQEEYQQFLQLNLHFKLQNQDSSRSFAQSVREVIRVTDIQQYPNLYVTMEAEHTSKKGVSYSVYLRDRFSLKSSVEDIEKLVEISDYSEYYKD